MKLLLSLVLAYAMMLGSVSATESKDTWYWHKVSRMDVFWINLQCEGEYVDFDSPPPNYDPEQDWDLSRRSEIGYESSWREYFWKDNPPLKWNDMTFYANDDPPNFENVNIADRITWWSMYFNEMYYEGGPVWDDELMEEFWGNLTYKGKKVDVYSAPPNYNSDLDYWSFMRDEIGYAWYWEYYFVDEIKRFDVNPTELKWKGIAFDVTDMPPKFDWDEYMDDPFNINRLNRGQLDRWAEYFVYEYS